MKSPRRGASARAWCKTHEANAFVCDTGIIAGLTKAAEAVGVSPGFSRRARVTTPWPWASSAPPACCSFGARAASATIRWNRSPSRIARSDLRRSSGLRATSAPVKSSTFEETTHEQAHSSAISSPVKYEGPKSDNPYAYRHYDPSHKVMGKTMADFCVPRSATGTTSPGWGPTCSARRPSSALGTVRR